MEKINILKSQEKKGNNNNLEKVTSFKQKVTSFKQKVPNALDSQTTLFGKSNIKREFRLNSNQFHLLSIFALNPESKFTRNILYKVTPNKMHMNTVSNFLIYAESNGLIYKRKILPGGTINTLLLYKILPDRFDDGSIVPKSNAIYYTITNFGIAVFELNEKYIYKC